MATRFFGRYEHSLDSKGRVILPAKFRPPFAAGGYLTQHLDGCLALWTNEEFDAQMNEMLERGRHGSADRNMARLWASNSSQVEVDRQGRMAIPSHLRDYAAFETEVLVLGAIDRVELWEPQRWEEKTAPQVQRLTDGLDD